MKRFVVLLHVLFLTASAVQAVSSPWESNPEGQVRLVVPYNTAPAEGPLYFGVQFVPKPGWMVYWKTAGEAGIPPKFDFQGSRGFENPKVLFPRPKYFILPGDIKEYGYDHEVVYPIQTTASKGSKELHIQVKVDYLTCAESCIPHRYTFSLTLPQAAVPAPDSEIDPLMQTFISQVPLDDEDVLAELQPQKMGIGEGGKVPEGAAAPSPFNLGWVLLLGFVGGVLLNVMPCVLPVLSIKLFGLLQHGGRDRRIVARDSLASAAGIIFSFLIGAVLAIVVAQAGRAVGWGIQFQSPWFVGFLIVILIFFTLNLWGLFEINLPQGLSRVGSIGQDDEGPLSYFLSGMFATLLATPCSAPFLGTAMGFALSQPALTSVSIFAAAGTGMALPYLMLAVFPGTLRLLPRPGIWMSKVKILMGFLLAGTAAWLGWVLYQQLQPPQTLSAKTGIIEWVPFKEEEIAPLLASGKPVFVDVTAEWCLTCKVNERFVLETPEVAEAFKRRGVVMMRADWTNQDVAIGAFLKKHGRAGIPFYVLYEPQRPPVLLSELLTQKQVLQVLSQIKY